MNHVMLDLETAGNSPGCAIFSIGAVRFDPHKTGVEEQGAFYKVINLQTCLEVGLKVDAGTIYWWFQQNDPARRALCAAGTGLREAIAQFASWFGVAETPVWSHGATFDLPIMDVAYRACGMLSPWRYWNCRDTRTLFDIAGLADAKSKSSVEHNAKTDAIEQARWVQCAYALLRGKK